jgi:diguanylate cyclase (GGDEF)-like protein
MVVVAIVAVAAWIALTVAAALYTAAVANDADREAVSTALVRARAVIAHRADTLTGTANDWAAWDDTYRFVKDVNPRYVEANLPDQAITGLDVDFMVFVDSSGRIVYSKALDPLTHRSARLPQGLVSYLSRQPPMLHMSDSKTSVSGVLGLPEGAYMIAAQPIGTSDQKSPPDGTFVVGCRLTPSRMAALGPLALLPNAGSAPISIYPAQGTLPADVSRIRSSLSSTTSAVVSNVNDRDLAGYSTLAGIDGTPALFLKVVQPRTALAKAQASIFGVDVVMGVSGLMFFVLTGILLDRAVLARLGAVSRGVRDVGKTGDPAARVTVAGDDEIAHLAEDINGMLDELGHSRSELEYTASHDPLTGLHNRRSFSEGLDRTLAEHRRFGATGSVLWLDVDNLKDVNDGLGHAAGDEVLAGFGARLVRESRGYSIVARVGGDEFCILLPHTDSREALEAASRLVEAVSSETFPAGDHEVRISMSVGVVTFPKNGEDAADLLSAADIAMYDAKAGGGDRAVVYETGEVSRSEMTVRIETAESIIAALREDRLTLYAQPIRDLADETAEHYELLLRVIDVNGAIVLPDTIIPAAERLGLIRDIDRWVAQRAIRLLAAEQATGRDVTFSINVSGRAFSDQKLVDIIRDEFLASGADPNGLVIEVTETATIANIEGARQFITALKEIGCRFSLDDFGSGASSFFYLRHLPVDFLKIDGTLVKGLSSNDVDVHFLRAIVEMCRGLGIRTIAEYVEDEDLLRAVRELGVDYAQGYEVGRPEPWGSHMGGRSRSQMVRSRAAAEVPRSGTRTVPGSRHLVRESVHSQGTNT